MDYSKLGAKYQSEDDDWTALQQDLERRVGELKNEINLKVADNLPVILPLCFLCIQSVYIMQTFFMYFRLRVILIWPLRN